jgi:hypothetical protein
VRLQSFYQELTASELIHKIRWKGNRMLHYRVIAMLQVGISAG